MSRGEIVLRIAPYAERPAHVRPLLDTICRSDAPLLPGDRASGVCPPLSERPTAPVSATLYDGPGLIFDREERILATLRGDGSTQVRFGDRETFEVRERLVARMGGDESDPRTSVARAIGAPLALLLARRGVFLLHASAIRAGGSAIVLTGESGAGKSTFAAVASRMSGPERLADDQFPVRLSTGPKGLPHWPQLKLEAGEQYPARAPSTVPLRALVELVPVGSDREPRLELLTRTRAVEPWIGSTVAVRLFDRERLRSHFEGVAGAVVRIPTYRFEVPRDLGRLTSVVEHLLRNA